MSRLLSVLLVAGGWLLLLPDQALAWGPATHVALGEAVLRSAALLPPAIRAILQRYPTHFLYGSIAADISFAKKYAPIGRHCHHWHVGEEILEMAPSEEMAAVGYGYLAHLAADTVAHNFYVPRRLLLTRGTQAVGHTYWEHRMDMELGEAPAARARALVVDHEHAEAHELFDTVLSQTLFSFHTNRRIFRGMILAQGSEHWRQVFDRMVQFSRFHLPGSMRDRYLALSYDYVMDYLVRRDEARPTALDPIGDVNLQLAKKVRRRTLMRRGSGPRRRETSRGPGDREVLRRVADRFFPLPSEPYLHVPRAPELEIPGLAEPKPPAEVEPAGVADGG